MIDPFEIYLFFIIIAICQQLYRLHTEFLEEDIE